MDMLAGFAGFLTGYIVPFLVSTAGGAIIAGALLAALSRAGALRAMQASLS